MTTSESGPDYVLHTWVEVGADVYQSAVCADQNRRQAGKKKSKHARTFVMQAHAEEGEPTAENDPAEQERRIQIVLSHL